MNTEAIDTHRLSPPPPPGAQLPPAPPNTVPTADWLTTSTRKPLTWATWAKASGLGFAVFLAISFAAGFLGLMGSTTALGMLGWVVGAFVGAYAMELRYAKAYAAVFGGVFLVVLAFDVVMISLIG